MWEGISSAEVVCSSWMVLHNTVIMFHLKRGSSASYILAHPVNTSGPTLGAKNVTQYYTNTVPQVHWGIPDIWLGLASYGSEVYPMLMGKGSSTRYEEMKQRGTSFLKTFIIYSIFSYVQHGRIHHIKCRWSLALTLALVTLTTLITGPTGPTGPPL